jgi:hypothetical protein
MQNEPNFRKSQMDVTNTITKDYGNWTLGQRGKNKAKTKPIQTQYKVNTNPKQIQFKAKQTQPVVSLSNLFLRYGIHIFDKWITSSLHKPAEVFIVEPLKYCIEMT